MVTRVSAPVVVVLLGLALSVTAAVWSLTSRPAGAKASAADDSAEFADATDRRRLAWIDRAGHRTPLTAPPRGYAYPRLSPDGAAIAIDIRDEQHGLWVWDVARARLSPLAIAPAGGHRDIAPVWSRTGAWVLFSRGRGEAPGLFRVDVGGQPRADGTLAAAPTRLPVDSASLLLPSSLTPDDREVVVTTSAASGFDLLAVGVGQEMAPRPLLTSPADELNGELSPDGRWLAYQSRTSGQFEIWVKRWDAEDGGRQLTVTGGTRPVWTRGGREIVYLTHEGDMMALALDTGPDVVTAGSPQRLFTADIYRDLVGRTFDVTADGERFLVVIGL